MDDLRRRGVVAAALLLACEAQPAVPPVAPAVPPPAPVSPWDPSQSPAEVAAALAAAPVLPGPAPLVTLCLLGAKVCYLLDADGAFRLRGPDGQLRSETIRSRLYPGVTHLPAPAMAEAQSLVKAALAAPRALPLVLVEGLLPPGRPPVYEAAVWRLSLGEQSGQVVAQVVPSLPQTHGALAPLARFFDEQLLGAWMNE